MVWGGATSNEVGNLTQTPEVQLTKTKSQAMISFTRLYGYIMTWALIITLVTYQTFDVWQKIKRKQSFDGWKGSPPFASTTIGNSREPFDGELTSPHFLQSLPHTKPMHCELNKPRFYFYVDRGGPLLSGVTMLALSTSSTSPTHNTKCFPS